MAPPRTAPETASRGPTARQRHDQQQAWADMVQQRRFSARSIAHRTGLRIRTVEAYLTRLAAAGFIVAGERHESHGEWTLADNAPEAAPLLPLKGGVQAGGATQNLWRSMRMMQQFTARDLAVHSTTPTVGVTESAAREYCAVLFDHGYLRAVRKATATRPATYRLVENTGPIPPEVRYVKRVWDANTRTLKAPVGLAEKAR
jgi:Tfp pilus assembly protein PilV